MPKRKTYDDDDGRTIADMSDVSRPPLIVPDLSNLGGKSEETQADSEKDFDLTKTERRAYIHGALGAALAVGSVFAIIIGLAIFIMTRLWA